MTKYLYLGYCRRLQDENFCSWYELEQMKFKAIQITEEWFYKNVQDSEKLCLSTNSFTVFFLLYNPKNKTIYSTVILVFSDNVNAPKVSPPIEPILNL